MANPPENIGKKLVQVLPVPGRQGHPFDARNILLIVAALIATVTFQAGVNPPGGVWQEGPRAGKAIYASDEKAFYVFLISNTLALSSSILVIISLTITFPFRLEIVAAMVSMIVTYGSAIFAVTPGKLGRFRFLLFAASVPFVVRCLIQIFRTFQTMPAYDRIVKDVSKVRAQMREKNLGTERIPRDTL